jgi:hypothetical protein
MKVEKLKKYESLADLEKLNSPKHGEQMNLPKIVPISNMKI